MSAGRLYANGETIRDLRRVLGDGGHNLASVRSLVVVTIRDEAWRDFIAPVTGEHFTYGPDEFARFVQAPPFAGLGSTMEQIRGLVQGYPDAERAIDAALLPLAPSARPHKGNNVTLLPTDDAERGNSREYTLRRLKRDAPGLAERVIAGELSANAAAIEAGFRRRVTPLDALRRAWGKANEGERAAFLAEIGVS